MIPAGTPSIGATPLAPCALAARGESRGPYRIDCERWKCQPTAHDREASMPLRVRRNRATGRRSSDDSACEGQDGTPPSKLDRHRRLVGLVFVRSTSGFSRGGSPSPVPPSLDRRHDAPHDQVGITLRVLGDVGSNALGVPQRLGRPRQGAHRPRLRLTSSWGMPWPASSWASPASIFAMNTRRSSASSKVASGGSLSIASRI